MEEFWLISAPGDRTPRETFEKLVNATIRNTSLPLAQNYKFNIPELKVGTLDSLIGLSDELGKLDSYSELVAKKVAGYMGDVLEGQRDKLGSNLIVNGKPLAEFLCHFQWDLAKYPAKQSLKNLADVISKNVSQVETDLKTKSQAYNAIKTNLQSYERKTTGSLLLRNLNDLVKEDDFILDSEYLVTILVAIPVALYKDWTSSYETLTDYVVPKSSRLLYEDNEYGLWNVTLFRKVLDDFKHKCSRNKFFVREFQYNQQDLNADRDQLSKLESDKKKMLGPLLRWLKVNFGEVFSAWIHVKALRVFVESVLRYGLPVNFQAVVLQPQKKQQKKLRETLKDLYRDLDSTGLSNVTEDDHTVHSLTMGTQEYYPYVYYKITLDFVGKERK
ncbi:V-type proton ATPase subunit C 2-like [Styela clava]|uniref:V-type proton ATPase subunit C 2-like n=1 Tax=Styela clava TaxID=7725 RepID=UPI0019393071|nr:V-type proton ATPase subunit C 2-like [Styela clava]